ncbi:hypothetical protein SDC9_85472 [bioreactor metagenome]|uniref:Uncharacterized protein n=1 Tax=bioreactor metagenome TaxID=1076179 RepID=A0A644ZDA2_9ZZZZ
MLFFHHFDECVDDSLSLALQINIEALGWTGSESFSECTQLYTLAAEGKGLSPIFGEGIPCIELFELCKRMLFYHAASVGIAIECGIMPDDHLSILGEMYIRFDDIHSHGVGALEGVERVLRKVSTVSAMGDNLGHRIEK